MKVCTGFYTSTTDICILMNRIVLWLQTHSWCNVYITCTSSVDCGLPVAPRRGSLESYTDTTEGSEVFYSCDPGLVPEGRMRAVCTRNGWSPNPADLRCVGVFHSYLGNYFFICKGARKLYIGYTYLPT